MNRLTAAKVRSLTNSGRYSDGEGLYLNIARRVSKSWVQRICIYGIRRDIGLGCQATDVSIDVKRLFRVLGRASG